MKIKRFSVGHIGGVPKQAAVGVPVEEVIRKAGISEQTCYRWKKQYIRQASDRVREMKVLQEENSRLKRLVAELRHALDSDVRIGQSISKRNLIGRSSQFAATRKAYVAVSSN